jgi:hypothetical protein
MPGDYDTDALQTEQPVLGGKYQSGGDSTVVQPVTRTSIRLRALSAERLVGLVLVIAIFAMAIRMPADRDTWWHLKSGQRIWESGEMLRADPFSHSMADQPWINYGWLAQVTLWLVYDLGGLVALSLALALAVTGAWALAFAQSAGRPYVAAFATLLGAVTSSVTWVARPQIISFLFASFTLWLLGRYRRSGSRHVWLIPPLVAVWANCHPGYTIALILIGCHIAGEILNRVLGTGPPTDRNRKPIQTLVSIGLTSALLAALNPHGIRIWIYPLETIRIGPLQAFIQEWASPNFHQLIFQPFVWLLLLTLVAMARSRQRADGTELVLVAVFGYLSLLAARNVALFALVTVPILARHGASVLRTWPRLQPIVDPPERRLQRSKALLNAVLLCLVLLGAGAKTATDLAHVDEPGVWGRNLPIEAVQWLAEHPQPGRMFNTYNWGGYLIWALSPHVPVFVDGRTDLYALDSQVLQDYGTVHWIRPGWRQVLDHYQVGFVLTERTGLLDVLLHEVEDWEQAYADDIAVIYTRVDATP